MSTTVEGKPAVSDRSLVPAQVRTLSKQQLIELIIKKGNERKRDQCAAAQVLVRDAQDHVSPIIASLQERVATKQLKIDQIERQRRQLDLELSGIELSIQNDKAKVSKREEQVKKSEELVKKQKDELRNIQKLLTPELVTKLYKRLESTNVIPLATMIETLIAILRGQKSATANDVQLYLKKHENMIYKMQNAVVARVTDEILRQLEEVHLETIKGINKQFIDPANEAFKLCNPFAPFLAWASQYIIFCKQQHQLDKVHRDLKKAEDDMQAKTEKKTGIKGIIDSLEKEGYVELFKREIQEDQERIDKY